MDVGAPAGTDVYSPVDGTVVSVQPYVLNGKVRGKVRVPAGVTDGQRIRGY